MFEPGDTVEAFGMQGVVIKENEAFADKINVCLDDRYMTSFYKDGKLCDWHKEPSLKLVKKAPKEAVFETKVEAMCEGDGMIECPELNSFIGKEVIVTVKVK